MFETDRRRDLGRDDLSDLRRCYRLRLILIKALALEQRIELVCLECRLQLTEIAHLLVVQLSFDLLVERISFFESDFAGRDQLFHHQIRQRFRRFDQIIARVVGEFHQHKRRRRLCRRDHQHYKKEHASNQADEKLR